MLTVIRRFALLSLQSRRITSLTLSTISGAIAVLFSVTANADLITFDDNRAPISFREARPLANQYASAGVTFSGGWEILNEGSNFGLDPLSGRNFAAFNTFLTSNLIGIRFDNNVDALSGFLGSSKIATWSINWFLDAVNLGSRQVVNNANEYVKFDLRGIEANYFTISSNKEFGVLDNLSFNSLPVPPPDPDPEPVPEPTSLALLGLGLAGIRLSKNRPRKTSVL